MKRWLLLAAAGVMILGGAIGGVGCGFFQDPEVAKGKKLFMYYCVDCHGAKGKGDGRNAKNLQPRPRDLTDSEEKFFAETSNEELFEALHRDMKEEDEDDEEAVYIPSTMPSFKNTLSEEEIWSLVAYIRTFHKSDAPKIVLTEKMEKKRPRFPYLSKEEVPLASILAAAADEEKVEEGRRLADEVYGCFGCHKIGGEGGEIGPHLDRTGIRSRPDWLYRWIKNPQAMKPKTKMVNLGITDDHAVDIVAYLTTLRKDAGGDQEVTAASSEREEE